MFAAFRRLLIISAASISLVFLGLFFARKMGSLQVFAPPPHPWFKLDEWRVFVPAAEALCKAPKESDWIVELPVKFQNGRWEVPCPGGARAINEVLSDSPHANWMLKVEANDTANLDRLVDNVDAFDRNKRIAIRTESQRVARYLRKKAPQWIFAADSVTLLRFQMFESMWLETAMDFWPDFVITPIDSHHLRPRAAEELKRRHKRIIWDAQNATLQPRFPIHGIMTTRPSEIEQFKLPK